MEKDIAISNILTPLSVGLVVMSPISLLTILSITSSIVLNAVLIYKATKKNKNIVSIWQSKNLKIILWYVVHRKFNFLAVNGEKTITISTVQVIFVQHQAMQT